RVGHCGRAQPHRRGRLRCLRQQAGRRAGLPGPHRRGAGSEQVVMSAPCILVVDDTPANLKLGCEVLAAKGYAVTPATCGEEALARIAEQAPDLIVLDIMMPGLSGYDVCRSVRANPDTALLPVVLCTSLDAHQERIHGIEAGADDFLSKP